MKYNKLKVAINKQNNSINGIFIYNKKKYFFKIINYSNYYSELIGYKYALNRLPVKKILYHNILKNNKYIIIYEYENSIGKNKGLLNDFFVKYDKKRCLSLNMIYKLNSIISVYNDSLKDIKKMNYCPNDIFFKERIDNRLKKWYRCDSNFDKNVIINGKHCKSLNEIIIEAVNYFNNEKDKICFFSQGDPNTLNIAINPYFFDLVTAGYNSIIGEFSIMFISTLFYDNYFCPKYHSKSYFLHEKALKKYTLFKPDIKYENKKVININCVLKSSEIRKKFVLNYIMILKEKNIKICSDIKYYIIMRLLCVFNIENMDSDDYYYSIYLVEFFYYLFKNKNENVLLIFEKFINDMEVI